MKLSRRQLRKLIMESLGPDAMERDEGGFDRQQQNSQIEDALYDVLAEFDNEVLTDPGFGMRQNANVDSHGKKILDDQVTTVGHINKKNVTYVYGFLSQSVFRRIFGLPKFGLGDDIQEKINKHFDRVIRVAKERAGHPDVKIEIGMTGNSVKYNSRINDKSVYTINRID